MVKRGFLKVDKTSAKQCRIPKIHLQGAHRGARKVRRSLGDQPMGAAPQVSPKLRKHPFFNKNQMTCTGTEKQFSKLRAPKLVYECLLPRKIVEVVGMRGGMWDLFWRLRHAPNEYPCLEVGDCPTRAFLGWKRAFFREKFW